MGKEWDAVVVGSGPNGLAAAITLAKAGLNVLVLEAKETLGGGCRTAELTLPGFLHDICSAIHPMAIASPFFKSLNLERHGLEWARSPIPLAHPLPDGTAVAVLHESLHETAETLGRDGESWRRLFDPFLSNAAALFDETLRPMRGTRHPLLMARFGMAGLRSCQSLIDARFRDPKARALFAGCAAHSFLPLEYAGSASFGLVLALTAHAVGWPCAKGGSQRIIDALVAELRALGATYQTNAEVRSMRDVPESKAVLFDLAPRQISAIADDDLPSAFREQLQKFRQGPGVFKIDWALSEPIPWRNPECGQAATVHVGGTFEQIAESEAAGWTNRPAEKPFVLVAQQSLFDPTRAPAGKHTGWAYCHVPNACETDMTDRIESQIERFAPGFRDIILARHVMRPSDVQSRNATMIGGDISGGANNLSQLLFRPVRRWDPYATPNPRLFICSSSTPPGGGVHGMCGYWSARSALRRNFGITSNPL
jgi:phytoene dehydrogenase-like protein